MFVGRERNSCCLILHSISSTYGWRTLIARTGRDAFTLFTVVLYPAARIVNLAENSYELTTSADENTPSGPRGLTIVKASALSAGGRRVLCAYCSASSSFERQNRGAVAEL